METEYTYLLHLMGAYLRREAPPQADEAEWDKLISLARVHGVAGIAGYCCPSPGSTGLSKPAPTPESIWKPPVRSYRPTQKK